MAIQEYVYITNLNSFTRPKLLFMGMLQSSEMNKVINLHSRDGVN